MTWLQIKIDSIRDRFNKALKCINKKKVPKKTICEIHIATLILEHNNLIALCRDHWQELNKEQQKYISDISVKLKYRLKQILGKFGIEESPSDSLFETFSLIPSDTEIDVDLSYLFQDTKMSQTITEFLNSAAKILPEFDGKAENLQSFIDALQLLELIKETHEAVAITLIKTKLKGTSRNLISNERTIEEVINRLKSAVKTESTEVLTAKLLSVKHNKNSNAVVKEVEEITNLLQTAYISEGLPLEIATKYATQTAVKSLIKNTVNDKTKLIMQAGQFNSLNDAITKYVSTTEENNTSSIFYTQKPFRNPYNNRGTRNYSNFNRNNRNNRNNTWERYNRNRNFANNNQNNQSTRNQYTRNRNNFNNNNRQYNARACETNQPNQGNLEFPLAHTGEQQ